jgi:hypothetical protein
MNDHVRPCNLKHQQRDLTPVLRRPVEPACEKNVRTLAASQMVIPTVLFQSFCPSAREQARPGVPVYGRLTTAELWSGSIAEVRSYSASKPAGRLRAIKDFSLLAARMAMPSGNGLVWRKKATFFT